MVSNLFQKNNPTTLPAFIAETRLIEWDYCKALNIRPGQLETASFEQLIANADDLAGGVTKVEMCFSQVFFGLFDSLLIKHHGEYEHRLMFYTQTTNAARVLAIYQELRASLGNGTLMDHKFSSFNDIDKIVSLSKGKFIDQRDDLVHQWNYGDFYFVLDYKTSPLRQLVLTVGRAAKRTVDYSQRTNGTLIHLLNHHIPDVIKGQESSNEPFYENDEVKFIDYLYPLNPPELGIFDFVKVRIFDSEKQIDPQTQVHLTYFSKYEIDTGATIRFCDSLVTIYGKDYSGYAELDAHELEPLDDSEHWTGRTWLLNTNHEIQNLQDQSQSTLYQVSITADPKQDGLSLHILAYNRLLDFHQLMYSGI